MGSFPDRKQESKILMLSKGIYNMYFHSQRAHKNTAVKKIIPRLCNWVHFRMAESSPALKIACGRSAQSAAVGGFLQTAMAASWPEREMWGKQTWAELPQKLSLAHMAKRRTQSNKANKTKPTNKNLPFHAIDGKPGHRRFHVSRKDAVYL